LTITHGTPVYIEAAVTPSTGAGNIAITGNSTQGNSGAISLATLTNGAAFFSTVALPGGSFTLVANYGGDSSNAASSSSGIPVTISSETSSVNIMLLDIDPTSGVTALLFGIAQQQRAGVDKRGGRRLAAARQSFQ
jgi:hypothetical protein